MAGDSKKLQPIIIKRVKRGGHAHHGGVWKIAYADFVTAMMAFFLLMWLLGSTTKGDLKGISDYFNTPLKVALLGGSGSGDSSSILQGGGKDFTRTVGQVREGEIEARRRTINLQALKAEQARQDAASMERLLERIEQHVTSSPALADYRSQIQMDITPDGLRIQIVDDQSRPMFDRGSARVLPHMRDLLRGIGGVLAAEPSSITLAGHTDAAPYAMGDRGYSNWELSADRANASRRELVSGGLPGERVVRVLGLASSALFDPEQPLAAVNRRISIIVMNRDAEDRFQRGGDVHWQDDAESAPAPDATQGAAAPAAMRPTGPAEGQVASEASGLTESTSPPPVITAPARRAEPGPVLVRAPRPAGPLAPVNLVPDLRSLAEAPDLRDGLQQKAPNGSSVAPAGR